MPNIKLILKNFQSGEISANLVTLRPTVHLSLTLGWGQEQLSLGFFVLADVLKISFFFLSIFLSQTSTSLKYSTSFYWQPKMSCHFGTKKSRNRKHVKKLTRKIIIIGRERSGVVVKGGDSFPRDCEFKSRCQILDGHFLHEFVAKFFMFVRKGLKINEKEAMKAHS